MQSTEDTAVARGARERAQRRSSLADLSPAYFGFVMATGIVAIAAHLNDAPRIAMPLYAISIAAYAERTGAPRWGLYKRRQTAVARLKAAIEAGELADSYAEVVSEATLTVVPEPQTRRERP